MTERTYTATKTQSQDRPGWSVSFTHPGRRDDQGRFGRKVRHGLGTTDAAEADRLVAQVNELLSDPSWWSPSRRADAERQFAEVVVGAFFDRLDRGPATSRERREEILPFPKDEDYARVMLVGTTGAGKTTLLRHIIGSDRRNDRFPSTSTAKTTTAETEIILGDGPFEAVVTFMGEGEALQTIRECLEGACLAVVRGNDNATIAESLLDHPEQRFRLSYALGQWRQEAPTPDADDPFADPDDATVELQEDESVSDSEREENNARLAAYVQRVKDVARSAREKTEQEHGRYEDMDTPGRREDWDEAFTEGLQNSEEFSRIALDIREDLRERFGRIDFGNLSPPKWPTSWHYSDTNRASFLKHVRWFTSNHHEQFGRLLTPLVDGVRVRGPFHPSAALGQGETPKLVLIDGEGLGHSAREVSSISTRVTERFSDAHMILLVDNAESPMQATPLELLRSAGSAGHGNKVAVAFTHVDLVTGDNIQSFKQRTDHVRASARNAIASLRESVGVPVAEILEHRMSDQTYYLGALDKAKDLPWQISEELGRLLEEMQQAPERLRPQTDAAPSYDFAQLDLWLRQATDTFKSQWRGRLGLNEEERGLKEHWARIKALTRRIGERSDNEYNDLRPVADLLRHLQYNISRWLEEPVSWDRAPSPQERSDAINGIRSSVFSSLHELAQQRLVNEHSREWLEAYQHRGQGSTRVRAREVAGIHEDAAPSITPSPEEAERCFRQAVAEVIRKAVEDAGGSIRAPGTWRAAT